MTIENRDLIADDLSVSGMFPKAWVRGRGWNLVIKRREEDAVARETPGKPDLFLLCLPSGSLREGGI